MGGLRLLLLPLIFIYNLVEQQAGAVIVEGKSCDYFEGSWVIDQSYPQYNGTTCPLMEREFNCQNNGRPDHFYLHYRWQPTGCNLQRFNGRDFLEKMRGKSIMFVGDSLSRNQWNSLVCLIYSSVPNARYSTSLLGDVASLTFTDYEVKVMRDRNVFLVDVVREKIGRVLKLDSVEESSKLWNGIDVIVFNTWHWWNRRGPSQPWDYIRVGNKIYKDMDRMAAFEIALNTWADWMNTNFDPTKTQAFFQGISPSHYKLLTNKTMNTHVKFLHFVHLLLHLATFFEQRAYAYWEEHLTEVGSCNLFEGSWVFDDSYPLYDSSDCPFINPGLNCHKNARPDNFYLKYRWNPIACNLPMFNGQDFLERCRGKKIMFVGDSLSSNQWQSLTCMVKNGVPNSNHTFFQTNSFYSLSFPEFGVSIMFMKYGFLVDLEVRDIGRVLKLDSISISKSKQWKGIDILIFNSYHWWIHTGNLQTWDYYQIGDNLIKEMDHMEAYKIALLTWANWVDSNINSANARVFFQGISAVHYDGKQWNEPMLKSCSGQSQPIQGSNYPGKRYPGESIVKSILNNMKTPVILLDITLLTQLRKDEHPSRYADGNGIDCSHWCVAGVPDTWNEILYTILLEM